MPSSLLRDRNAEDGEKVGFIELFFDLVFVFAATQLSHRLIEDGSPEGVVENLVLFLAVWSVWTSTTWVTNWMDVDRNRVRLLLLALMIGGIFQMLAIPDAFKFKFDAQAFAAVHIAMQVGRALFVLLSTAGRHDRLHRHFQRVLIWFLLAAPFWIAGAWGDSDYQLRWWAAAVAVEFAGQWFRYWIPARGRSSIAEGHVQANHFAERCGLFVIIALGENILVTGSTVGELTRNRETVAALVTALVACMAMWWIYFSYSQEKAAETVEEDDASGRAARIVYVFLHIPLILGLLVNAAGDEPLIKHPGDPAKLSEAFLVVGGPALFLLGEILVKRMVCGGWITSHIVGLLSLLAFLLVAPGMTLLHVGIVAAAVLVVVAIWEELAIRRRKKGRAERGGDLDVQRRSAAAT